MVHKNEHDEEDKKLEHNYNLSLKNEIKDYMRNGDMMILKRVLFKLFVNQNISKKLKQEKAHAVIAMLIDDHLPDERMVFN